MASQFFDSMLHADGGSIIPQASAISLAEARASFRLPADEDDQDPLPPASPEERMRVADAVAARSSSDAPGSPGEAAVVESPRVTYGQVVVQMAGMRVTLPAAKRWPYEGGQGEILELHSGGAAVTMAPESGSRFDILEAGTKTACLCVGSAPTTTGVLVSVVYDDPTQ